MARPSPSCAHDDDRLRLPAASLSRSNSAEKKESTDPRLSQLCPPYVTPSSSSSLEYHRSDARIVENGFAAGSGMSNSAKVGLVAVAILAMVIVPPALAKAKRAQSARPQQGYQSSERPGYYHGYPLSDVPLDTPEFTHLSDAEQFLAKIAALVARGELDIQTGLELSTLAKNWIESQYAREELAIKQFNSGSTEHEQVIRVTGGLPPL